jgi:acylphosphatase
MSAEIESVRLIVTGGVQGVGYRIWASRTATRLGLRGWVRNRDDGSVEALVTGARREVAAMIEACWSGPPAARVAQVTATPAADDGGVGFVALPTV